MQNKKLSFYFDFVSPYSFFAWEGLLDLAARLNLELEIIPVLFAGLLNAHGQLGPAEIPAKREYVFKDVMRLAAIRGISLQGPPTHPFNPLMALRLVQAVSAADAKKNLVGILLKTSWQEGLDISDKSVLRTVLTHLDLPAGELFAAIETDAIKNQIKENTARAIADKVFGVPSFVVEGELFWGHDRLPMLESWLKGEFRVDEKHLSEFMARPRAADRKSFKKS